MEPTVLSVGVITEQVAVTQVVVLIVQATPAAFVGGATAHVGGVTMLV
jgi:hypothetical protein